MPDNDQNFLVPGTFGTIDASKATGGGANEVDIEPDRTIPHPRNVQHEMMYFIEDAQDAGGVFPDDGEEIAKIPNHGTFDATYDLDTNWFSRPQYSLAKDSWVQQAQPTSRYGLYPVAHYPAAGVVLSPFTFYFVIEVTGVPNSGTVFEMNGAVTGGVGVNNALKVFMAGTDVVSTIALPAGKNVVAGRLNGNNADTKIYINGDDVTPVTFNTIQNSLDRIFPVSSSNLVASKNNLSYVGFTADAIDLTFIAALRAYYGTN